MHTESFKLWYPKALNLLQIQGRQKYCCLCSGGTITLADGQRLQYDWLVLALGSSTSFFGIPGVKDLALPFNDFKDAMKVEHSLVTFCVAPCVLAVPKAATASITTWQLLSILHASNLTALCAGSVSCYVWQLASCL